MTSSQTPPETTSTTTTGQSQSETPSPDTSLKKIKNSELFHFDPATVTDAEFGEIVERMKLIVKKLRVSRGLAEVADARAAEEAAVKAAKKKKKPLMERTM